MTTYHRIHIEDGEIAAILTACNEYNQPLTWKLKAQAGAAKKFERAAGAIVAAFGFLNDNCVFADGLRVYADLTGPEIGAAIDACVNYTHTTAEAVEACASVVDRMHASLMTEAARSTVQ